VTVESIDLYGLAAEQKNIRVRGVRGFLGAMTVAGVPNYGGNPMGPREYIYDTENFDSIAVYKGAVPADLGTSNYSRSFIRLDSGNLPRTGTGLSLELTNLFNKEYVSVIKAMDDSRAGRTSYYAGAPFTAMMTVAFDF
jgi:iron complex outermembrane recepter protein